MAPMSESELLRNHTESCAVLKLVWNPNNKAVFPETSRACCFVLVASFAHMQGLVNIS